MTGAQAMIPILRDKFTYSRADGAEAELFRMSPVVGMVDLGKRLIARRRDSQRLASSATMAA